MSGETEAFLAWVEERGRAGNTVAAYRRDLASYERFLAGQGRRVADVTPADVEAYVDSLTASGRKPASVARALVAVRALHRFAGTDPAGHVSGPEVAHRPPPVLAEDEVARLLEGLDGDGPTARRDRAIVELLYATGMRVSELVGLSLGDLDQGMARVGGPQARVVPYGEPAAEAVAHWLAPAGRGAVAPRRWRRSDDAGALFLNLRGGRLSRQGAWAVVRGLGGPGGRLGPHLLRHCFAAHLLARGASAAAVQQLLGHPGPLTADQLRQVYDRSHPRAGSATPAARPEGY